MSKKLRHFYHGLFTATTCMRGKSIRKRPSPHSNLPVSHQSREVQGTASLMRSTFPPSSLTHPQEDPVTLAENQLIAALDELENIGALQRSNRIGLEEFLNPPGEAHGFEEVTDEDIFNAVMEARREEGHHDGDDIDTDTLVEPTPTREEALQAALTIIRYIKDKDGAYFRELEASLALFVSRLEKMADIEP